MSGAGGFYRKVLVRVWVEGAMRRLTDGAKLLRLRLLTGPETTQLPGVVSMGRAACAESMGWSIEHFMACFGELERAGLAVADWTAPLIWMPEALLHRPPDNPSQVKGWRDPWAVLPESTLLAEVRAAFRAHCTERGGEYVKALDEAITVSDTVSPTVADTLRVTVGNTVSGTVADTEREGEEAKAGEEARAPRPARKRARRVDYSPEFEVFWSAYPPDNRDDKARAWQLWNREVTDAAAVMVALANWTASQGWAEGYVPNATKFVRERYWTRRPRGTAPAVRPDVHRGQATPDAPADVVAGDVAL